MPQTEARMTVQWFVPRGSVRAISTALNDLLVSTRAEPGCLGCFLSTQMSESAGFKYVEEWDSEADLKRHLCSDRFAKLAQLLESATVPPHVEFSLPGGLRGLDYADAVRMPHEEAS
jgi:quinol monooxygenase YgiN